MMTHGIADGPRPRPGILDIAPYVPGKSGAEGRRSTSCRRTRSPLGASPAAIAAYRKAADTLELYPDGSAAALREAIAQRYGLEADRIVCGAGSDELLQLIAHAYLVARAMRRSIRNTDFSSIRSPSRRMARRAVVAEERDHSADVDAMLAAVSDRARASSSSPIPTIRPAPICR